jgi:YfiR/HmsC-like
MLLCSSWSVGQSQPPGEYEVKAAFLYNFAKFVEWPAGSFPGPGSPLRLCALLSGPAYQALEQVVEGKTLNGRPLQVRQLTGLEEVKGCHLLFIGVAETKQARQLLHDGLDTGVLTVGEREGFAQAGGMINLVLRQNHVAFEINVDAANRAGLKISSKLLSLATIVHDDPSIKREY